jgi:hypothetical protein
MFSYFRCETINLDYKRHSGEGIAEVGGGTDEGFARVYAGTNVVGSDGAAAAMIAVVTQGISLRKILTALRPALVAKALRSGIGAPDRYGGEFPDPRSGSP